MQVSLAVRSPLWAWRQKEDRLEQGEVHRHVLSPRSWGPAERSLSCEGDWKRPHLPPRQFRAAAAEVSGAEVMWPGAGVLQEGLSGPAGSENCPEGSRRQPQTQLMKKGQGGQGAGRRIPQAPGPAVGEGDQQACPFCSPQGGRSGPKEKRFSETLLSSRCREAWGRR